MPFAQSVKLRTANSFDNKEEMMLRKSIRLITALAAVVLALGAQAQDYPVRPIRIIQGFAPGGNADSIARLLGQEMSKSLGQPVVVEAKPGAGGNIAAEAVAMRSRTAIPCCSPWAAFGIGRAVQSARLQVRGKFRMDFNRDGVSVRAQRAQRFPAAGRAQLIAAARVKPDAVSYGSAGVGSTQHLTGALLASQSGTMMLHVPYKGDAGSLAALLAGDVDFVVAPGTATLPHVKGGRLKAIAVTGAARWQGLPDVPTVQEGGVEGFDVGSWAGLATTAGTPRAIVERLNTEVQKALQVPEVRARLESFGGEVRGSTPEEMRNRVATEVQRWSKVIADAHIQKQ